MITSKTLFFSILLIIGGILGIVVAIKAILKKETYYIGGIKLKTKENPIAFPVLVIFELIVGTGITILGLWYLITSFF